MTTGGSVARVRGALSTAQNRVVLVAVAAAVVAGYWVAYLTGEFAAGFLALVVVGVGVPYVYETRREATHEAAWRAVLWTVEASALATTGFLVGYEATRRLSGSPDIAAGAAFVATWALAVAVARRVGSGSGGGTSE